MKNNLHKITVYTLSIICFCIFCFIALNGCSPKVRQENKQSRSEILSKCKKVHEDLLLLYIHVQQNKALGAFFPFPDWLVSASNKQQEKHGLVWFIENDPDSTTSTFTTYKDKLHYFATRPNNPYLMHRYKALAFFGWEPKFDYADISTRTIDPFSPTGNLYQYHLSMSTDTLPTTYDFFIIISNGPDEDIDIDVKELNNSPPNYGLPKPIIEYAYDPTNGIVSNGDIFMFEGSADGKYPRYNMAKEYERFTGNKWPSEQQWKQWFPP
jgi:hypothetical protein